MDSTIERHPAGFLRARRHPLAGAVLLTVLGGVLAGCATHAPARGDTALRDAQSAYARQDYRKAAELLAVPAMQGNAEAQYALGYLYYYGRGVRKDQRRARAWFEDAARLGHAGARQALELMTVYAQMPPLPGEETPVKQDGESVADPAEASAADNVQTSVGNEGESRSTAAETANAAASQTPAPQTPVETTAPAATQGTDTAVPAAPAAPPTRPLHSAEMPAVAPEVTPATTVKASWRESSAPALQRTSLAAIEDTASSKVRPRYTIHLLSSRNLADLERLVQAHGLTDIHYYAVDRADGRHYRLIFGGFQTMAEARRVLDALPHALQAHRPWVNNYPVEVTVSGFAAL